MENELWCIYPDGRNEQITEHDRELISKILTAIREFYPEAYSDLSSWFRKSSANVPYFQFLMVEQFGKCNFGELDTTRKDVDKSGMFNFERVRCPLRGRCQHEGKVCNPKFNSSLSDAELRVMKLVADGIPNDTIAEMLYLSPHTVKNHIKSVYAKLGVHSQAEFLRYANNHNLFK